jgi:tRNA-Thr(GGU) m(6)t(6)A37 methyltransferase TsaA
LIRRVGPGFVANLEEIEAFVPLARPSRTRELSRAPSRWYLTGFLVPLGAPEQQRPDGPRSPRKPGTAMQIKVRPIGRVASSLIDMSAAPRQADEGAPEAWIEVDVAMKPAIAGLSAGDRIVVITWLDQARRDVLEVHPRGDTARPLKGVFGTRSPHRPNPIGLHVADIAEIDGTRIRVRHLEAINDTPVLDIKPVLEGDIAER